VLAVLFCFAHGEFFSSKEDSIPGNHDPEAANYYKRRKLLEVSVDNHGRHHEQQGHDFINHPKPEGSSSGIASPIHSVNSENSRILFWADQSGPDTSWEKWNRQQRRKRRREYQRWVQRRHSKYYKNRKHPILLQAPQKWRENNFKMKMWHSTAGGMNRKMMKNPPKGQNMMMTWNNNYYKMNMMMMRPMGMRMKNGGGNGGFYYNNGGNRVMNHQHEIMIMRRMNQQPMKLTWAYLKQRNNNMDKRKRRRHRRRQMRMRRRGRWNDRPKARGAKNKNDEDGNYADDDDDSN